MEMFKQPGRLDAPICTKCGNEMTWVRSVLITAEQVIASRFIDLSALAVTEEPKPWCHGSEIKTPNRGEKARPDRWRSNVPTGASLDQPPVPQGGDGNWRRAERQKSLQGPDPTRDTVTR